MIPEMKIVNCLNIQLIVNVYGTNLNSTYFNFLGLTKANIMLLNVVKID